MNIGDVESGACSVERGANLESKMRIKDNNNRPGPGCVINSLGRGESQSSKFYQNTAGGPGWTRLDTPTDCQGNIQGNYGSGVGSFLTKTNIIIMLIIFWVIKESSNVLSYFLTFI